MKKQTIKLNECQLRLFVKESVHNFLNESAQDKAAIRFLKSKGVDDYEEQKRVLGALKHNIPNLRLEKGKFVVAALRMYYDGELRDQRSISSFDKALSYIHKGNHAQEYDFDLNGLSLTDLNNKYSDLIKQDLSSDIERSNNVVFSGTSDYRIIPIKSYEEASKYGKYTSWCVTHGEDAYDSYTEGGKRFYFCLKNGFENLSQTAGGNVPLDEYGLSMISVLIDMDGSLDRLTTRWNHDYDGENNPGLSTPEQLEKVINLPFYKTFKPYTRDELHAMGIILFDEVQELLNSEKKPEKIFDNVYDFYDGFAAVQLNGKWNFINTEGKIISPNQWFDYVCKFYEGFAKVSLKEKWNFINRDGELLSQNQWFDRVFSSPNGFPRVFLYGKWNFINREGKILSPNQWFDHACDFYEGFAKVSLNEKWYYINTKGELFDMETNLNENNIKENKQQFMHMKENVVRLNESQFRQIIKESVEKILKESSYDANGNFMQDEHNQDLTKNVLSTLSDIENNMNDGLASLNRCATAVVGNEALSQELVDLRRSILDVCNKIGNISRDFRLNHIDI